MENVQQAVKEIEKQRHAVLQGYVGRLKNRMQELIGTQVEPERILQEAALLVDRSDIQEELVRLDTHVKHFLGLLDHGGGKGEDLGFVIEHMNTQGNTPPSRDFGVCGRGPENTEERRG